jgi:hypothetical protein
VDWRLALRLGSGFWLGVPRPTSEHDKGKRILFLSLDLELHVRPILFLGIVVGDEVLHHLLSAVWIAADGLAAELGLYAH